MIRIVTYNTLKLKIVILRNTDENMSCNAIVVKLFSSDSTKLSPLINHVCIYKEKQTCNAWMYVCVSWKHT